MAGTLSDPYPDRVETKRLELRRWREDDLAAVESVWRDPEVWRPLRFGAEFDQGFVRERFQHHLDHWEEHGFGLWLSRTLEDGEVAGWVGCSHPDLVPELTAETEVGWALRAPLWGHGLATQGARAAVAAGFDHLGAETLVSVIHPSNSRSAAVARRLGMERAREVRHGWIDEGLDVHALSRAAWTSTR